MPIKKRARLVASSPSTSKLFVDDLREIAALARAENQSSSYVIRELVHEALRIRRLRAIGRDEGEEYVRKIHREAVAEGVTTVTSAISELHQLMEQSSVESRSSAANITGLLASSVAQLLQRVIVTENAIKTLMRIGMEKDNLGPEEIKKHLLNYEEMAVRQSQAFVKRIIGGDRASAPLENV